MLKYVMEVLQRPESGAGDAVANEQRGRSQKEDFMVGTIEEAGK